MSDAPVPTAPVRPQRVLPPIKTFIVADAVQVGPRMRRIFFEGDEVAGLEYQPGQDLALLIHQDGQFMGPRHYTIRGLDRAAGRMAVDFVLHGHGGPAEQWALAAKPGDRLEARGPRGRTVVNPQADWHLFTGDETCIPGVLHMLETLPAGARARVFLEVEGPEDEQPVETAGDVELTWIHRGGPAQPGSPALIEAFANYVFPAGRGHAYVIGETSTVRTQRQGLLARGFEKTQISAEGYWRPGRQGGHEHIFDEGAGPAR